MDELDQASTILHRLSDAAIKTLSLSGRNDDNLNDLSKNKEWCDKVQRLGDAAERFVKKVLEEHGIPKQRLTRQERKRNARLALGETGLMAGILADRIATSKRRKTAMDALVALPQSPVAPVAAPVAPVAPVAATAAAVAAAAAANFSNVKFTNWSGTKATSAEAEDDDDDDNKNNDKIWVKGKCYICREQYHEGERHSFYPRMCRSCGDFNLRKRQQTADLRGRYALVTGGRVKIGFEIAVSLLRAGCHVIVTTRLPNDALKRFAAESDFETFRNRLEFEGIDLRFTSDIEALCTKLKKRLPKLDILINNAAQTIRRPPQFYQHLLADETKPPNLVLPRLFPNSQTDVKFLTNPENESMKEQVTLTTSVDDKLRALGEYGDLGRSAKQTQLVLAKEDEPGFYPEAMFPAGKLDAHQQQLDLRPLNSWIARPEQISVVELAEVHTVNAMAPFLLFTGLLPLLRQSTTKSSTQQHAFVIMVTAEEGTFNRYRKYNTHVHTNMAKAAMNQITRSCAERYAKQDRILINSVDTGWVDDMTPVGMPRRKAFQAPLADPDGAARVLDPVFVYFNQNIVHYGVRFKDYAPSEW